MADEKDFQKALGFLLQEEGGFNNVSGDSGGATNHGISLRLLQSIANLNGTGEFNLDDLDHDGDIDILDIKAMTPENTGRIFKKYFWDKFPMAEIPAQIAYALFDVAINSGHKTAAILLQRAIGIQSDGIIGKQTLYMLKLIDTQTSAIANRMISLRRRQYNNYVKNNPALAKFLTGWLNRMDKVTQNIYEFS
jgi:type VI secretion system secreted protein VgrG